MPLRFPRALIVLALSLLIAGSSHAASLGLSQIKKATPDIFSGFVTVNYNASTDVLTATGMAFTLDAGSGPVNINAGSLSLNATINDSGILTLGSFTIGGKIPSMGFNSGTLITATPTAFGFEPGPPASETLEFFLTVTGGDAAALYGGVGSKLTGLFLHDSGYPGPGGSGGANGFSANFGSGQAAATSDFVAMIPLPASVWMALPIAGMIVAGKIIRRNRVNNQG